MKPLPEQVHWLFATGLLILGLWLLAEAIVGRETWRRRRWRAYAWPAVAFAIGLGLWPVMVLFTASTVHMLAHGVWAQAVMFAGATQLALVRGKLRNPLWELAVPFALVISGAAFLIHEQNGWLYARSAFLHHAIGWTLVLGAVFPLARVFRPRSWALNGGYAMVLIVLSVLLYCDRDIAPIFGHLSDLAETSRR